MKTRATCRLLTALLVMSFLVMPASFGSAATLPSINSTSQDRLDLPATPVTPKSRTNLKDFRIFATNDLGMHCGDLDYRVAAILPPFNVIRAQVIIKNPGPRILTGTEANVYYSAASNPKDPALQRPTDAPIYKTNFWNYNSRTTQTFAFDAYDSFYPADILRSFPLTFDIGLPVPDVERLYLGDKQLVADQQAMPDVKQINPPSSKPYVDNLMQKFQRYNTDYPLFISFPFGYTLLDRKWFAAEGVPMTPFDDFGRKNSYPLLRIQAKDKTGKLSGVKGQVLASVDTVAPVSAEADCWRCHTSAIDGGNGQAACIPGPGVSNCPREGSPTNRSGVAFPVTQASQDTAGAPLVVSREWAADWNILRLHDAKHGTTLADATPVACQRCHYSPALDLAQAGPVGPIPSANGREQTIHRTNSRVMHAFHGNMDLFDYPMPKPTSANRINPATGKPVINVFVTSVLNQTCYQCHPGRDTHCLRGAMFSGGLVCQDCHGGMKQVGDDFSSNFPVVPFPAGADMTKRIPWASEPGCQSCHTGDALTTLAQSGDPYVIPAKDGIRLLQAYRTSDASATPISAPTSRFAENQVNGNRVLYRLSTDNHAGIFCEGCHGSTHAEWPVKPASGNFIANDNQPAIQLQGHAGKIMECTACHPAGTLPVSLDGPHGMHPVNDSRWVQGHEDFLDQHPLSSCQTCHGKKGEGIVLSKAAAARSFSVEGTTVKIANGQLVKCSLCHSNPIK
jgi:hypothetical protein